MSTCLLEYPSITWATSFQNNLSVYEDSPSDEEMEEKVSEAEKTAVTNLSFQPEPETPLPLNEELKKIGYT